MSDIGSSESIERHTSASDLEMTLIDDVYHEEYRGTG